MKLIISLQLFLVGLGWSAPTRVSQPKYVVEDDQTYLVIDDMLIRQNPERSGLTNQAWPRGIVPYSFSSTITTGQRETIKEAMDEIADNVPCITFRPFRRSDKYNIHFNNNKTKGGCSSAVGWQKKRNQYIQVELGCSIGNIMHEIIHALGFFHEHTRNDRDEYVKINWENIQEGAENNFLKDEDLVPDASTSYYKVPYNLESIMHYRPTSFSANSKNIIDVLDDTDAIGNGNDIGQRDYISLGDKRMIRAKYNCPLDPSISTENQ